MKVLAVIPARGGSKGIPHKNTRSFCGRPLFTWTVDAALQSKSISHTVVSSDDPQILALAAAMDQGLSLPRPAKLASDTATTLSVILHALDTFPEFDWVMVLQPTSPLRTTSDIEGLLELCSRQQALSAVSVCESGKHPSWMFHIDDDLSLAPVMSGGILQTSRQELRRTFLLNGAIYLAECNHLRKHLSFLSPGTVGFVMPPERSVDIDTEFDWCLAEYLVSRQPNESR
jgi:CMP-N,N'-diacetyllegionaminic acid synthase